MAKAEPLGDVLYSLLKEIKSEADWCFDEKWHDLVEKAHFTAKAVEKGMKAGSIPTSSPTVIREMGMLKRNLKKRLDEEYGSEEHDDDTEVDVGKAPKDDE